MYIYRIRAYLKFLFQSTNQHGVHSPFVYQLVTRCLYDRRPHPAYKELQAQRRSLLQNKQKLEITQFGAGSSVFKGKQRAVREMVKTSGMSLKRGRLLNRLVRYLQVERALELGTSLGLGTAAIASQNKVVVNSIEGCPVIAQAARENLAGWGLSQVKVHTGTFTKLLQDLQDREPQPLDLVYIDGDHQEEATLRYFEDLLPHAHNESVFIFDDIHWSPQMESAWNKIVQDPRVRVSIDTYRWGMVFFRKEQVKEHFVIRV